MEEAGEVVAAARLSALPALQNAAKEYEARKRREQIESGISLSKGQAPAMLLAILAAIERLVNDTSFPLYIRAYGWYRLFRHWASLRFDDTMGCDLNSLTLRARGVAGLLHRTKTSGPDKSVAVLPFCEFRSVDRGPMVKSWIGDLAGRIVSPEGLLTMLT